MSDHLWMLRQEAIERLEAAWLHRLLKQPELLTEEGEAGVVDATVIGHVSVIPVHGVIAKGWRGDVSPLAIENAVNWSLGNPNVRAIVLDIDSPGGGVTGLTEAASTIFAAREQKPIVAVAAHQATSAALWLGSAAGELVVSPSGEIGSIGV